MKEILILPRLAELVIHEYMHLPIGGKEVVCPYYINKFKERAGLRVLVGKGDPGEIVKEVRVWAKLKDFDVEKASVEQIREFMISRGIGIDCSGFVVNIIGYLIKCTRKKHLQNYLKFPKNDLLNRLRRLLRPVENMGADMLTSELNCRKINNLNNVRPGDFIRSKGKIKNAHHIMLVRRVTKIEGVTTEIEYVHSSRYYEDQNGIRFGLIKVVDPLKPLAEQKWLENLAGKNYTFETFLNQVEDNGIRRLKNVRIPYEVIVNN